MGFCRFFIATSLVGVSACQTTWADTFINTGDVQDYYLSNVPDFDQRRMSATVQIGDGQYLVLGLPGNGSEYCVPTSATDWSAFLANRGYPNMIPGPGTWSGSWTDGVSGLGEYNDVDLSIDVMGILMQTDSVNGTYGQPAQQGMQSLCDTEYYGYFTTVNVQGNQYGLVSIYNLADSALNGSLIEPYGGWYVQTTDNQGNTAYYRNGGHATAMASASWTSDNFGQYQLGLCNPWTGDDQTVQSPFTYTPYTTQLDYVKILNTDSNGNPLKGSGQYYFADWLDQKNLWLLDGALQIQPLCGYTIHHNWLWYLSPLAFVNQSLFSNSYELLFSADQSDFVDVARSPLSGDFYYITSQGGFYSLNPVSQISTAIQIQSDEKPRQILFGADVAPFVLMGDGSVRVLDLSSGALSKGIGLGDIDQLVFDPGRNAIAAVDWNHNRYFLLKSDLSKMVPDPIPLVAPQGSGPVSVQFGPKGHLMYFQTGDPNVYDYSPNIVDANGIVKTTHSTHYLPAVQDAASFSVDDTGKLYFSLNGQIETLDANGRPLQWVFNGLPSGEQLNMSRSVSNYDPKIHHTYAWRNVPPASPPRP